VYYLDITAERCFTKKGRIVLIEIDPNQPQPLFEQVVMQVKFAIAAGTVRANEMIPSVRLLAKQLAVNPNTVVRAFRLLQEEEILVPRRGIGLVVAENCQDKCLYQRKDFFKQRLNAFIADATRSGLSKDEIASLLTSNS